MRQRIESLSPRQFEILVHVARHLSSREISQILGLSPATVDSHIAAALQKLGLPTRRDAALRMIELGFAPPPHEGEVRSLSTGLHHGGEPPSNLHELPAVGTPTTSNPSGRGLARPSRGDGDGSPTLSVKSGMGQVIKRCLLDGLYIILFFAIMSAVAFVAHEIVIVCEESKIDPFVLLVLRGVSYMLVILDAVGVVTATGLLTYRFIRAIMRADD
jgi:DNA-binding CsgD family transcriptional regulator